MTSKPQQSAGVHWPAVFAIAFIVLFVYGIGALRKSMVSFRNLESFKGSVERVTTGYANGQRFTTGSIVVRMNDRSLGDKTIAFVTVRPTKLSRFDGKRIDGLLNGNEIAQFRCDGEMVFTFDDYQNTAFWHAKRNALLSAILGVVILVRRLHGKRRTTKTDRVP